MGKIILLLVLGFTTILFSLSSCRHTSNENGIPFIVQHRYWNYYERGIAYSLRNEWSRASEDFKVALGINEGALYPEYQELRRSKTYGVHFINNYFPHRELGICHYFLGDLDTAEEELLLSLEMLPSSRAKFFVNKVRRAKLSRWDQQLPNSISIAIDLPAKLRVLNRPWLALKGEVSSFYKVSEIRVNGKRELIELASQSVVLDSHVSLAPGRNRIEIVVHDLSGNSKKWEREIISDLEGPSISMAPSISPGADTLRVEIKDGTILATVSVDGQRKDLEINSDAHSFELPSKPTRKIRIEATDNAGNRTVFEGSTGDLQKAALETESFYPDQRLAGVSNLFTNPIDQRNESVSDVRFALLPSKKSQLDSLAPIIRLYPEIPEELTITSEYYVLDLSVEDPGFINSISLGINDKKFTKDVSGNQPVQVRFTQTVELKPEENHIVLSAQDKAGNVKNKKFRIYRKQPIDKFQKYRMTLTADINAIPEGFVTPKFFDLASKKKFEEISELNLSGTLNKLILSQKHRRFNLLERDEKTMSKLMLEHKIIHSSLRDFRYAVETNKLRNAEWYLKGSLSLRAGGKDQNWVLTGELIDVQEGTVIAHSDTYFEGISSENIEYGLRIFVNKMIQQLPLHSAILEKAKKQDNVIVPLGIEDNIKRNFRFMFIAQNETNLRFADPLMIKNGQWVQGIVTDVAKNECLVEIFPKGASESLHEKDTAFLR